MGNTGERGYTDTEYAAIRFENMVRQAKSDGRITTEEALELLDRHALLQKKSRESLNNVLKALMVRADYQSINQNIHPSRARKRIVTLPEPDIDYHRKSVNLIKGKRRSVPQKVVWLSIVGPAALASLLGLIL